MTLHERADRDLYFNELIGYIQTKGGAGVGFGAKKKERNQRVSCKGESVPEGEGTTAHPLQQKCTRKVPDLGKYSPA